MTSHRYFLFSLFCLAGLKVSQISTSLAEFIKYWCFVWNWSNKKICLYIYPFYIFFTEDLTTKNFHSDVGSSLYFYVGGNSLHVLVCFSIFCQLNTASEDNRYCYGNHACISTSNVISIGRAILVLGWLVVLGKLSRKVRCFLLAGA
jgi:hypothetical protein